MDPVSNGSLLVSTPMLDGTSLARSVCLLMHQSADTVVGVVLNRPIKVDDQHAQQAPILKNGLHFGGPNSSGVYALHNCESLADATTDAGLFVATQQATLEKILEDKQLRSRLIVGTVQWTIEELESQMNAGCWTIMPATEDIVFSKDDNLWERLTRQASAIRLAQMVGARHIPPHPAMN